MADTTGTSWDAERTATLRRLWEEGLSAGKIAARLSDGDRTVSRNTICGKLHRLGLSKARQKSTPTSQGAGSAVPAPAPAIPAAPAKPRPQALVATLPVPAPPEPEHVGPLVDLMGLRVGMCRWPIGDPMRAGFGFCGHASREGSPYCERHASMAYDPERARTGRRVRN